MPCCTPKHMVPWRCSEPSKELNLLSTAGSDPGWNWTTLDLETTDLDWIWTISNLRNTNAKRAARNFCIWSLTSKHFNQCGTAFPTTHRTRACAACAELRGWCGTTRLMHFPYTKVVNWIQIFNKFHCLKSFSIVRKTLGSFYQKLRRKHNHF